MYEVLSILHISKGQRGIPIALWLASETAISEFELQLCYCAHFLTNALEKGMIPPYPPAVFFKVPLKFFYKDCFGIK